MSAWPSGLAFGGTEHLMSGNRSARRSNQGAPILRRPLTPEDREMLARSLIVGDMPDRALLARVEAQDAKDLVGAKDKADYSGIEIPYIWPGELSVRGQRIRRDHPEIEVEYNETGHEVRKERRKYVAPVGSPNLLYFFPETPIELLSDLSVRILIAEGEKKCLCAWCLATHNSSEPRFLPIGISGVWNWRGRIATADGADGKRRTVRGPIPDLARIPWHREVLIAFDSDVHANEDVQTARAALGRELRKRGATRVRYVQIPCPDQL
jgi:hypothetical protein